MEAVAFFEEESNAPRRLRLPLCIATLGLAAVSARCAIGLHPSAAIVVLSGAMSALLLQRANPEVKRGTNTMAACS